LKKLGQIPISVEYTSVTTQSEYGFRSFTNWVKPLTRGLLPPDPHSFCPLSSPEFVEPPLKKIPGYATEWQNSKITGIDPVVCDSDCCTVKGVWLLSSVTDVFLFWT
jgi:hypothetical protein